MPGWEALVRIQKAESWATPGTVGSRGIFLNIDSTDLDYGATLKERDGKIIGVRESLYDSVSFDNLAPRGGFTFQPRVDDIIPLLMAHFQWGTCYSGGTYVFFRKPTSLTWTSGGSNWGTHPYSVNVDLMLGNFGTNNGIRYMNGIVESLKFSAKYGGDLQCTPTFKFLTGSYWNYPTSFVPTSVYGSLSAFARLVDYMGTVGIGNLALNFESWEGNFNNNTSDAARLGYRGYQKFPFSGKWIGDGQVEFEIQNDIGTYSAGSTGDLSVHFFAAAGNAIKVLQPNIVFRNANPNVTSGDAPIMLTKPYRAYPPSGTTGPSTIVYVYTGTVLAPLFGSCDGAL